MDVFRQLRRQATTKRDLAIEEARRAYRKDIASIRELEQSIPAQAPRPKLDGALVGKTTQDLIAEVMPKDRPWKVPDLMRWLRDAKPDREFSTGTVRTYLWRMSQRGLVRKLYRTAENHSLWVAAECAVDSGPIETRGLADVIEMILREDGEQTAVEIAVAMQEWGYREDANPKSLARAVRGALKRYPGRFYKGNGGKWGSSQP